MRLCKAFEITGISKHQYYHKPKKNKRGVKASEYTHTVTGNRVNNGFIVEQIKQMHQNPDTDYGYIKVTYKLKTMGYVINKKKVYRLMKENNLLGKRYNFKEKTYAKYRKVLPKAPLHVLEMDIKFVWVEQARKHAYILTIIDTFTRVVLYYTVRFSITKTEVKQAWEHVVIKHLQPNDCLNREINIEVRNDNDKRFSAAMVRDFFKENSISQVFTHPYTPQENGHVESFHSILSKRLKRYIFWSLEELEQNLVLFYEFYNNERLHGSIAYTNPQDFWLLWKQNKVAMTIDEKKKKITFKLKVSHHHLYQLTGNNEPEGSSLHVSEGNKKINNKMISAETSIYQLTV